MYYLDNARTPEQRAVMESLLTEGICIFCDKRTERRAILVSPNWNITPNSYPYDGTEQHLLLTPVRHVTAINKLNMVEWVELQYIIHRAGEFYPGYSVVVRNGDMEITGATVEHLHFHVLVPNGKTPLIARLSKKVDNE